MINDNPIELRAYAAPWRAAIEFLLRTRTAVGVNIEMRERNQGERTEPTFRLSEQQAQTLMDDLWNAGLRPTEGTGSAGSLAATQRHLDDMRCIVFGQKSK